MKEGQNKETRGYFIWPREILMCFCYFGYLSYCFYVPEYFPEISCHVSEKCLIPSYPIMMKFYFNSNKNVVLSNFYI